MNMRLLYFTQFYAPILVGGGEHLFFNIGREMVRRGHEVYFVAQKVSGLRDYEEIDDIQVYRVPPEIEHKGYLPTSLGDNIGYVLNATSMGLRLLREKDIDLIHSNTYAPAIAGEICALMSKKPHIITIHDIYSIEGKGFWSRWYGQKNNANAFGSLAFLVERMIVNMPFSIIHTVSDASRRDIEKLLFRQERDIIVIPNGINLNDYQANHITYDDFILYIGRLIFYKNIDKLIKAFKLISKLNSKGKLIVIGDGPMRLTLQGLVSKLNLMERVHLLGRVSHKKKVEYLSCATALALPSVYEGFGIVILEAWALKKPVIVADVSPLNEIVEHGRDGFVADPYNPEEWAEYVKLLLENKDLAQKMGENGYKKLINRYTIEKTVDKLEQLYKQIIFTKRQSFTNLS